MGTHLPAGTGVTRAGHRASFCGTPVTLGCLLHFPVVTLAWGTEPCRLSNPCCCSENSTVQDISTMALGAVKEIRGACDVGKDFSCNLCGKLIAVDYKPSAILLIHNTRQQPFKRAALHPAPQTQNSHIIEQHDMELFKKQIGFEPGKGQEDWEDR